MKGESENVGRREQWVKRALHEGIAAWEVEVLSIRIWLRKQSRNKWLLSTREWNT